MKITCNNIPRPLIYGYELTPKEKADFDYIDVDEFDTHEFFRYRGAVYDPCEFMRIEKSVAPHCQRPGWENFDGYHSDTFFSAVLLKYVDHGERVIVGVAYS